MTFKEKIVRLRKIKSLTQDEFASAVGVSRQAVYKWESGQSYPEVPKLIEIKMLFGISIDDLLDDTYEVQMPEKKRKKRVSTEEKKKIEKKINEEESLPVSNEAEAPVVEEPTEEVKKEVISETSAEVEADAAEEVSEETTEEAPEEEIIPEQAPATEVVEEVKEEPKEEEALPATEENEAKEEVAEEANSDKKKKGFFSRIFSKK